ncbi:Glycosyltransferase involved in cell wall bisynthesis [Marinactinospora thermotolerans DSM 45154]|uniref:Glucosyl-3-phosphoglycerate synthase n=1 Tax=Marinactinospora thermotolerans DSM 45154 TaxID=1122192 RepID=A0A1T4T3C5_9ACTN|nr:glycosyltransferase family 2 protein [Marinactinospora thermotolerans]SKA34789.1 Glycosyltransferase involved in cell wall bisynthesis [Marinactinospora thermotolerans DSM 45154]
MASQAPGRDARARVAAVIPAKDEAERIASTVRAARALPGVDLVLVVDDGSTDGTATVAADAGARVVRHGRNRGKGAAMESGAEGVRLIEEQQTSNGLVASPRHLLFLDADLADTASGAAPLIEPVLSGAADMTIALFPATRMRLGGHGFVVRLAREGIRRATGWEPEQPLNGQRCLTRAAFEAARPLAPGFGVETGLTIDLLRQGFQVLEVEVPLEHRATGTDLRAQLHRARQFADVGRALAARELRPTLSRGLRNAGERVRGVTRRLARGVGQAGRKKH